MHQGQKIFLKYMLDMAKKGEDDKLSEVLFKSFEFQKNNKVSKEYFETLKKEILKYVKPEYHEDVAKIIDEFSSHA